MNFPNQINIKFNPLSDQSTPSQKIINYKSVENLYSSKLNPICKFLVEIATINQNDECVDRDAKRFLINIYIGDWLSFSK
jgi:hypothetical protein